MLWAGEENSIFHSNRSRIRLPVLASNFRLLELQLCHEDSTSDQLGHDKTHQKISQPYWWRGIRADVKRNQKCCFVSNLSVTYTADSAGNIRDASCFATPQTLSCSRNGPSRYFSALKTWQSILHRCRGPLYKMDGARGRAFNPA